MKIKTAIALVLFTTLLSPVSAYSQFRLTSHGLVNDRNKSTEYYVVECPGMERQELFRTVSYYMESRLNSPWSAFNAVEPDSFTVNAVVPGAVVDGKSWSRNAYDLEFHTMIAIRDGLVLIWIPEIISMTCLKEEAMEGSVASGEAVSGISIRIGPSQENVRVARLFVSEKYIPGKAGQYRSGGKVIYNKRGKLKNKYAKQSLEDYFNSLVSSLERYIRLQQDL